MTEILYYYSPSNYNYNITNKIYDFYEELINRGNNFNLIININKNYHKIIINNINQ